jgi:hypothetical protein
MALWVLVLATLLRGAAADYLLKQQFTDAACSNMMLGQSIMPSGCMSPLPGSPSGPTVLVCGAGGMSATLNNYAVGDPTCAGASSPSTLTINDGNGVALASWACTRGTDNGAAPLPPSFRSPPP